ncbi:MAG TPA: hypothetical protein PKK14_08355 [Pseudomonadales bacterium]|nr:hypothetical protein [Pseudomonadales bacterium]
MNDTLVQSIFSEHKLKTPRAQKMHIENLRQPMREIWHAYKNDLVKIDYSKHCAQEAYLLRYFLPYANTLESVLKAAKWQPPQDNPLLEVCLLGCGPAPELLVIINHLKQQPQAPHMLVAHFVDIAADTWCYGQRIAQRAFLAEQWDTALLDTTSTKADLCSADLLNDKELADKISGSKLVVIQNCLNEANHGQTHNNLIKIISMMRDDAHLLIIDRNGYKITNSYFKIIDMLANINQYHKQGCNDAFYNTAHINSACSAQIKNKLLYAPTGKTFENDGLILSHGVKHSWRLLTKTAQG